LQKRHNPSAEPRKAFRGATILDRKIYHPVFRYIRNCQGSKALLSARFRQLSSLSETRSFNVVHVTRRAISYMKNGNVDEFRNEATGANYFVGWMSNDHRAMHRARQVTSAKQFGVW
jgi:hypothetical protein